MGNKNAKSNCETCAYYCYDEYEDSYYCEVNLDEDEMCKFLSSTYDNCPYYQYYDEYEIARKQ